MPTLADVGDAVIVKSGPAATPVPESATVWGLVESLSATDNVADSADVVDGVNLMLIVQVPLAARLVPHVLLAAKSDAFVPAIVTELMLRVVDLLFDRVAV